VIRFFWFLLPGAAVWGLDRLRRLYYWFGQPADIVSVESANDVTCIKFKKKDFEYRAGQFVFILLPQVSRFQLHPFSISSSPRDNCAQKLCLLVPYFSSNAISNLFSCERSRKADWKLH
jgi:predicted ferric reductase